MPNFSPRLEDATEKQLTDMIDSIHITYASLASDELSRRQAKKSEISNYRFSVTLMVLTFVQITIALMQYVLDVVSLQHSFLKEIVFIIIPLISIYLLTKNIFNK